MSWCRFLQASSSHQWWLCNWFLFCVDDSMTQKSFCAFDLCQTSQEVISAVVCVRIPQDGHVTAAEITNQTVAI